MHIKFMSDYKEGDRIQYKIDLSKENISEGTIQKVLKGGESLKEVVERSNITPRYVSHNGCNQVIIFLFSFVSI